MKALQSSKNMMNTILVIGGTGKTGKRVVTKLSSNNINVRVGSRSEEPAFDWNTPATWNAALQGVKAVYLTYFPDLALPQAPAAISDFCEAAEKQGVKHIVLLSGRGEPAAQHCEKIVQDSGMAWTIIRASWFNQNFSEGAFYPMVVKGVLALPVTSVREPFVDIEDIADVAVAALTEQGHNGKLYEVTGPRLLTFEDVAAELSKVLSNKVQFISISEENFKTLLHEQNVPEDTIDMLLFLFSEVLDGRNAVVCDGVERALGRPARDFSTYATKLVNTPQLSNRR